MLDLQEAKEVLRIDIDDNDDLILSLIDALPSYIELSTGLTEAEQINEPMAKTVSGFILKLWYYSDHTDDIKLQRTIDNLLKYVTLKARKTTE